MEEQKKEMNIRQKMVIAIMDVLIIVEMCISIYFANQHPSNFEPMFFKLFLAMAVSTFLISMMYVRRLRSIQPELIK